MTAKTKKLLIIGAVVVGGYLIYKKMNSGDDSITAGIRASVLAYLPNDPVYATLVNSLSAAQVTALAAWNAAQRPSTWQSDPVLAPVLNMFKNSGGYFF